MSIDLCCKSWMDYLSALGPLVAALIAIGVAIWQGKIQNKQKSIALLDRQLQLRNSFSEYIEKIRLSCTKMPNEENSLNNFVIGNKYFKKYEQEALILFSKGISKKIKEIGDLISNRWTLIIKK